MFYLIVTERVYTKINNGSEQKIRLENYISQNNIVQQFTFNNNVNITRLHFKENEFINGKCIKMSST